MSGKSMKCFVCGKRVLVTKFHIKTSSQEAGMRYFHKRCYKPGIEEKSFVGKGPAYINCEFCGSEIEIPQGMDEETRTCPHCGAIYWLELPEDLCLATQEAAEHFGVSYDEMFEKIGLKVVRDFDQLGEEEYKEEVRLVFARKKTEA